MEKNDARAKLLFAMLNRSIGISETIPGFTVDYSYLKLDSSIIHNDAGMLRLFSGVFFTTPYYSAAPFALSFYNGEKTNMNNLALPYKKGGVSGTIRAYLSIIDYLCDTGMLRGNLQSHIDSITKHGCYTDRVEIIGDWNAFKVRAAKDLPYDMSLEVLEDIAHCYRMAA